MFVYACVRVCVLIRLDEILLDLQVSEEDVDPVGDVVSVSDVCAVDVCSVAVIGIRMRVDE